MPIEGFPDAERHRFCLRCHRWFEPHEGTMVFPEVTGPVSALRDTVARLADDESAMRFMCHRCLRVRRMTKASIFIAGAVLLAGVLIWRWLTDVTQDPLTTTTSARKGQVITLTPEAAHMVRAMQRQHGLAQTSYLRVAVQREGPTGFSYALDITDKVSSENDIFVESHGVRIIVDRSSEVYLVGATIDYRSDENGTGFWLDNPNAMSEAAR